MAGAGKKRAKREGRSRTAATAGSITGAVVDGGDGNESQDGAEGASATQSKGDKLELDEGVYKRHASLSSGIFYISPHPIVHTLHIRMEIQAYRSFNKATNEEKYLMPTALVQRKGWNTQGQSIAMLVNSYKITNWPVKKVHQYDVLVGSGIEKRALIKKVWHSKTVKTHLGGTSAGWLFDGNKLAWAQQDLPMGSTGEVVIWVDLDREEGITPREGRENRFRVVIRKTGVVDLSAIREYLDGNLQFDPTILQGINFLDHLMRETPSQKYTTIKQSFFKKGEHRYPLGGGVEAFKGVYQSIRPTEGRSLTVNVDVSNGVFWTPSTIDICVKNLVGCNDAHALVARFTPKPDQQGTETSEYKELRRLKRVGFFVRHRGAQNNTKLYRIEGFTRYNMTALTYRFDVRDKVTKTVYETNVKDYFLKKYQISLRHPNLPLVKAGRSGMFPMELCTIAENQRYPFKLGPEQTASMIKFAVTRPPQRMAHIQEGINMLSWADDPVLKQYGVSISPTMTTTNARLLPEPTIQFKGATITGTVKSGKWNIQNKKFLRPNPAPLKSWGVLVFAQVPPNNQHRRYPKTDIYNYRAAQNASKTVIDSFIRTFVNTYISHGGIVENKSPFVQYASKTVDIPENVNSVYQGACNQVKSRCQILMIIVDRKLSWLYLRIKRTTDTVLGVVSQCCYIDHVIRNKPEYSSNVAMKFNAKLGGTTSAIAGRSSEPPLNGQFPVPTIVIGADVSHGAAGQVQASTAAITVSLDRFASRYGAICNTNGVKLEMITTENIQGATIRLTKRWIETYREYPQHVYYFRDGVSEGQYQQVLDQEIRDLKAGFRKEWPNWHASRLYSLIFSNAKLMVSQPKFVVTIASKRHHIRFFAPGNKPSYAYEDGNPKPGTLVERDVTHPYEFDFYLCSHKAIQGTARPVHYHVILDEAGVDVNSFQRTIFHHCYSYMRSCTAVSLYPAVYYAHLASNRCRAHMPSDQEPLERETDTTSTEKSVAVLPLLPVGDSRGKNNAGCWDTMWFI
ncbi:MAG: hypothetical protein M1840_002079 [Geoglossum simile]|nr:MAG: hypothetical protein M1840_002079 [Geoglossum simile]